MGLLRNLTAAEIVGQVLTARHQLGVDVRNVVFMGMGSPWTIRTT
jgi:23S rRNA (adenine2503-C2)-methyltransferase